MGKVAMILRRAPYGDMNAAEAVRHAMGGAADDLDIDLILVDSGVQVARKGQDDRDSGFISLENALKDCIDMGVAVYAEKLSVRDREMEVSDMLEGVSILSAAEIASLIESADTTMIF